MRAFNNLKSYRQPLLSLTFLIMVFVKGMGLFSYDWIYKYIVLSAFILFIITILLNHYSFKQWIVMPAVGLLSIIVYWNSKDITILLFFVAAFAAKDIDYEKIIKRSAIFWNAGLISTITLSSMGLKEDVTRLDDKAYIGKVYRHSLGFNSDVALSITVTIGIVLVAYSIKRFNIWKLFLLECLFPILFTVTFSYTSIVLGMITVFLLFLHNNMKKEYYRWGSYILFYSTFIPIIISFPLILHNIPWKYISILNKLCTNRLIIARSYMDYVRPTLFGQVINTSRALDEWGTGTLDNVYINMYLNWGIVAYALMMLIYAYVAYVLFKQRDIKHQIIIAFYVYYGFAELFIRNPFMNVGSLIIGSVLMNKRSKIR